MNKYPGRNAVISKEETKTIQPETDKSVYERKTEPEESRAKIKATISPYKAMVSRLSFGNAAWNNRGRNLRFGLVVVYRYRVNDKIQTGIDTYHKLPRKNQDTTNIGTVDSPPKSRLAARRRYFGDMLIN
ncbi:MAG: hypothetical protein ACE14S_09970 [Candidatus Bathyarchaeia archaeon]